MTALVVQSDAAHLPLADDSVDLIVTSPPYFALRSYQDGGEHYAGQIGSEPTPAEFLEALWTCTREWMRVLKPSGSLWVNLGDSFSRGQRFDSGFTAQDAAWLAGVIDSDGSISIRVDNGGRSHVAWTRVGQMKPEVVQRIGEVTGVGQVWQDKRGVWNWNAAAQQACWVLERIWPWLRIKQRQALAAIDLMTGKAAGRHKGRWNPIPDAVLAQREVIRQAVLAWNDNREVDYVPPAAPLVELPRDARFIQPKSLLGMPWRYAIGCIDQLGLILRAEVVWSKPNGLPESVTDRVRRSHEQWFHFTLQPRYFAAVDEIREGYAPGTAERYRSGYNLTGVAAAGQSRNAKIAKDDGGPSTTNPLGKLPGSVWTIPSEPLKVPDHLGVDHFAAFPTEWPRRIIQGWSPSGICTACDEPRRPVASGVSLDMTRPQARRAHELAERAGLTEDHYAALLSVGVSDTGRGAATQTGTGKNTAEVYALADHARSVLGGYAREYLLRRPTGFTYVCACPGSTAPTRPAVVLDPFGGTGTTALCASVLGRTGISVDLSHDYSRLAQWRTTDSGQRAKAARVDKPPVQVDGQDHLFGAL